MLDYYHSVIQGWRIGSQESVHTQFAESRIRFEISKSDFQFEISKSDSFRRLIEYVIEKYWSSRKI